MIGSRIKEYRKSRGLKVAEFAKKIGISQGSLSNIENGISKPSSDTISSIVRNTDIDPIWLLVSEYEGPAQRAAEEIYSEEERPKGLAQRIHKESMGVTPEKPPRGLAQRIAEDGPEADSSMLWDDFHLGMGDSMELLVNIHKSGNKVLIRAINANLMAFNEAIENKERSEITVNAIKEMKERMGTLEEEMARLREENLVLHKKLLSRGEESEAAAG